MEPNYNYQNQNPNYPPVPQRTNGKAITALVLGILSLVFFFWMWLGLILGILGIVFGKLGLNDIKRGNGGGKGMAMAGFVCGIVSTSLYVLILLFAVIFVSSVIRSNPFL